MKLKLGDVVKNPKSHNWGYGKVFEVTSDKIVKVRFENIDHTKKISAATLEKVLAKNEKELKYEKMSYFEFLVQIPIDEIDKKN